MNPRVALVALTAFAAAQSGRLPPNHRPDYPLTCRGGERLVFDTLGAPADTATTVRLALTFLASPTAAGPEGRGLPPASCAWVDRPVSDDEPRVLRVTVHVSDSTPRATIRDTGLYWSFLAHNSDSGHFTAAGYRHWHDSSPPSPHLAVAPASAPAPVQAAGKGSWLPFKPSHLPLYVLGWMLIAWVPMHWLIARWSGWHRLAGHYPDRNHGRARPFRSAPLVMGKTNYRNGARLTADDMHLHFAMGFPARPGHPPFSVPWSDLTLSPDGWPWVPFKGRPVTRLTLAREPGLRILLPVAAGERIGAARFRDPAPSIRR